MTRFLLYLAVLVGLCGSASAGFPQQNTTVTVMTATALRAMPTSAAVNGQVLRVSDGVVGAAPLTFTAGTAPCATDDGASCLDSADGKSWIGQFPASGADASEFGVGTGVTDNSVPLQAWMNYACTGATPHRLTLQPGIYNFATAPLVWPATCNGAVVTAGGMYSATLNYTGSSTTPDLEFFGPSVDTGTQIHGWYVEGINVNSTTVMTAGAGVHLSGVVASTFKHDNVSGQYAATNNLWNGIWCDFCFSVWYDDFEASAQNDGIRASGTTTTIQSGFTYSNCKISHSTIGVHLGGATGADSPINCDIIADGIALQIDEGIIAKGNVASTFDSSTNFDTCTTGPCVLINDTAVPVGQIFSFNGTWEASSSGVGVYIENVNHVKVIANFANITNNAGDGLKIADSTAIVSDNNAAGIYNNGGFGIDAVSLSSKIYMNGTPTGNSSGAWNANATLGTLSASCNGACYTKDFQGIIWAETTGTLTGAANTTLTTTLAWPITFPNAVFAFSDQCVPYGFENGVSQMTVAPAISPTTTGTEVGLVSSVTVTVPQRVVCKIVGY